MYTNILLVLMVASSISCTNSNSSAAEASTTPTGKAQDGGSFIECKVNGELIRTSTIVNQIIFVPSKKETNVFGKTETGMISLIINPMETVGVYEINGSGKSDAGMQVGTAYFGVKEGKASIRVTITSIEEFAAYNAEGKAFAVRGTFEGNFVDQDGNMVTISEGKFSSQ